MTCELHNVFLYFPYFPIESAVDVWFFRNPIHLRQKSLLKTELYPVAVAIVGTLAYASIFNGIGASLNGKRYRLLLRFCGLLRYGPCKNNKFSQLNQNCRLFLLRIIHQTNYKLNKFVSLLLSSLFWRKKYFAEKFEISLTKYNWTFECLYKEAIRTTYLINKLTQDTSKINKLKKNNALLLWADLIQGTSPKCQKWVFKFEKLKLIEILISRWPLMQRIIHIRKEVIIQSLMT